MMSGLPGPNDLNESNDFLQDHPLRKGGGRQVHRMRGHSTPVRSVAFSRDGTRVVSVSLGGRHMKIWNVETGVEVRSVAGVR